MPMIISYIKIPRAHQSRVWSWPDPAIISGAARHKKSGHLTQVLRCATERVRLLLALTLLYLGEAEIGKKDVAIIVQKNVLWLQVAVDNSRLVQVAES